ncbi:hypothetical protein GF314_09105 [bacterium]|nr:hypothetical protein [bacterium]
MLNPAHSIPRSGLDQPPAVAPDAARCQRVRAVLAGEIAATAAAHGLEVEGSADPWRCVLRGGDLTLPWLCDFAEAALKSAIGRLSADLVGGANVTRLDGAISYRHPRLPYRRALRIVAARGWRHALGDELAPAAAASLVRFCALLPVQVMYLPNQPQPGPGDRHRPGLSYVVPWGGEVLRAVLPAEDESGPAVIRVEMDRLLGFALGYAAAEADG